jgi:hydroxyethylthiazole kinase-like uncharacterized protein yjeF
MMLTTPPPLPLRPLNAHKGTFGSVIVIGGCQTMFGAPALAARAALRMGAGLVKLCSDAQALPWMILAEPSATGLMLADDPQEALAVLDEADPKHEAVLAIGPGWGPPTQKRKDWRGEFLWLLLAGKRRLVVDADGLNVLANIAEPMKPKAQVVLTPHPGEFTRLARALGIQGDPTHPQERAACALGLAKKLNATVLLKGRHTLVTDGAQVFKNHTGNPVLAAAGSGDVLTGAIASLMAQGMTPFDAACLGAHLHGRAADRWRDAHGDRGMLARELADGLAPGSAGL